MVQVVDFSEINKRVGLNKVVQVFLFLKNNKICCTIIWQVRVRPYNFRMKFLTSDHCVMFTELLCAILPNLFDQFRLISVFVYMKNFTNITYSFICETSKSKDEPNFSPKLISKKTFCDHFSFLFCDKNFGDRSENEL